ncbi:hypothetical protein F4813DRAFT_211589 [Daldinia decipiens]|uniref:uncharacterized protein n=1 Tax=Daldinia decipiens TaxID=326647 RepID=UPI0020C56564|nr:uncharacterized protein F4813DRAFT_211589 [Daldinia decipiens]KAI1654291.1 hypothetical protein F4813DRAFT_211589 [Daldinia decipiens]
MATQIRDTQFGHLVRFLSRNKIFRYPDEVDPSLWKRPLQGDTGPLPIPPAEQANDTQRSDRRNPGTAPVGENDREFNLINWYGPDDPENPQNWSSNWKLLVAFLMCILNFSFYIASSIYVPIPFIFYRYGEKIRHMSKNARHDI